MATFAGADAKNVQAYSRALCTRKSPFTTVQQDREYHKWVREETEKLKRRTAERDRIILEKMTVPEEAKPTTVSVEIMDEESEGEISEDEFEKTVATQTPKKIETCKTRKLPMAYRFLKPHTLTTEQYDKCKRNIKKSRKKWSCFRALNDNIYDPNYPKILAARVRKFCGEIHVFADPEIQRVCKYHQKYVDNE